METSVLSSTALLTVLLAIGLVFFIRASAKDRTEVARLVANQQEVSLLEQLQRYFTERAYRVAALDPAQNLITFEGFVRPSVFLAGFLMLLAAVGLLCLALVLAFLFPAGASAFLSLVLLSPLAGLFYWRKSARQEQVLLRVEPLPDASDRSLLTVTAHRDELAELRRALGPALALRELEE